MKEKYSVLLELTPSEHDSIVNFKKHNFIFEKDISSSLMFMRDCYEIIKLPNKLLAQNLANVLQDCFPVTQTDSEYHQIASNDYYHFYEVSYKLDIFGELDDKELKLSDKGILLTVEKIKNMIPFFIGAAVQMSRDNHTYNFEEDISYFEAMSYVEDFKKRRI
jgi:hypothetical protein